LRQLIEFTKQLDVSREREVEGESKWLFMECYDARLCAAWPEKRPNTHPSHVKILTEFQELYASYAPWRINDVMNMLQHLLPDQSN